MPEVTLTIRPQRASRIAGATAWAQRKAPVTFTSIAAFHSATGSSQNGAIVMRENTAALLMRQSMRPNRASVRSARARVSPTSATSVRTASARPPLSSISAWTRAAFSSSISAMIGMAPCAAKWWA